MQSIRLYLACVRTTTFMLFVPRPLLTFFSRFADPFVQDILLSTLSLSIQLPNSNYYDKKKSLSEQKLSHMQTMYGRWIDPDRWPVFLPTPPLSTTVTSEDTGPPRADRSTRRKMNCSVAGCDGTGHKNPAKWEQGHTTRAGCPIFHAQNV